MIRLVGVSGSRNWDWHLTEGKYVIGRSPNCDLVLKDDTVSRNHAQIEIIDERRVILTDLISGAITERSSTVGELTNRSG